MPMVAAVATLEPETAAKIAHEKTLATASPPGRNPTQRATAVKSPRPMPECRRIALMKTKSGTAMKEKRSEEHTSELQSQSNLVCRLLLEKKKQTYLQHAVGSLLSPSNCLPATCKTIAA